LIALGALALVYAGTRRAWPLIVVAVTALALLAPAAWQDRLSGIGDTENPDVATRLDLWGAGLQMFAEEPITGVGLNGYGAAYVEIERTGRTFLGVGSPFDVPENAHNLYLTTLAEQGLLGVAALGLLVVAAFRLGFSLRRAHDARVRAMGTTLLGMLVVILVQNLFDLTLFDPKTSVFVWAILGVAAAVSAIERTRTGA
jgi:O-antigen ligase